VGIGKTTAVTAHLLRRAHDDGLRRLIVVAPWTNVISQTVRVLRKALVLDGEEPQAVVAEHHHRAEFSERGMRDLAATWKAPIVVTTAVQLFGTLSARAPASLRKLHALPGSAVFLDEAHAALPARLWRQNWAWMRDLAERWWCRFVLASGSLARFWEEDVVDDPHPVPDLVGEELRARLLAAERRRVRYVGAGTRRDTIASLCDRVTGTDGPRLVILNTVEGAGRVAHELRERGHETYHLSTALAPKDREPIIDAVSGRLAASHVGANTTDWTLVATSCVEAGVDFSFRTAFRERWSSTSLIQIGGRANRNAVWDESIVHDVLMEEGAVPSHPGASPSDAILARLLLAGRFDDPKLDPAALVTEALVEEVSQAVGGASSCGCWRKQNGQKRCKHASLSAAEANAAFPCAASLGEPISDETLMVVVDADLRSQLRQGLRPSFQDLVRGTVRMWPYKVHSLGLCSLAPGLHDWTMSYDPAFLGYMQGVIERGAVVRDGGFIL
jgi:CRISPR-associated endonuclease/helicase Cas3